MAAWGKPDLTSTVKCTFSGRHRAHRKFERCFSHGATDGSPRREPWNGITMKRAAERRKNTSPEFSFAPAGACECFTFGSHGSRRGLPSNAAPQLFSGLFRHAQKLIC